MLYLMFIPAFVIILACGKAGSGSIEGFQSRDKGGERTYLFSHYEVLDIQDGEVSNPFEQGQKLTDKKLTITWEMLGGVGQCLYQVQSERPLSAHTPAGLRELLAEAQPLTKEQKYVPLTQVYDELKDLRDLYGHRMPWYYHYIAIGGTFTVLNGLFDIATHDAQAEAIKIAQQYLESNAYRRDLVLDEVDEIGGWMKDIIGYEVQRNKVLLKSAKAEHKLEELFGRFIYAGREVNFFGRKVNLNPLWALKEKAGKKFVPLVQKTCTRMASLVCISAITSMAGIVLAAATPLAYFATNKLNEHVHREEEQHRLLDIIGDWDNFRTFTLLKPKDMQKLKQKMAKLSGKGTHDCPPPDVLADKYIDKKSRSFY